jgi:ABC-type lipoprotein export system ATPase subunit
MPPDSIVRIAVNSDTGPLSIRARQVCASFDVPPEQRSTLTWEFDFPYDAQPWQVGLVVGPSGTGKSTVLRHVWGEPKALTWTNRPVVDDFDQALAVSDITNACGSVGFNTIPAWLRPYDVLSNGEKFRVDLARRLLEGGDLVVIDEFTSVVDRQVAKVGSHAVQKYVRKTKKKFVAVTCHYDVVDWLQPDWVLDMATRSFTRRSLQRRPNIDVVVGRLPHAAWSMFKPFHYMNAGLHRGARCFGVWANGTLAGFCAILHFPHPKARDIRVVSRSVTLPDWQGLGLTFALRDTLGAAYKAIGYRLRSHPGHPSFIRSMMRSATWKQCKEAGYVNNNKKTSTIGGTIGSRPSASFEYCGPAMKGREEALALLGI